MFNVVNPLSSHVELFSFDIFLLLLSKKKKKKKKRFNNFLLKTNLDAETVSTAYEFCNLKMAFFLPGSSVATQKLNLV